MIAAYGPSLSGAFVYEDSIAEAQALRTPIASLATHPARALEILIRHATPADAQTQRAVTVGWHLLNGVLLFWLLQSIAAPLAAVCAVGLFWLHPLQTEAVAYVSGRPELLAGTWLLLALLAVSRGWFWPALIATGLGITGKEMAVMAWVLVPLFGWQIGRRWSRSQWAAWTMCAAVMFAGFLMGVRTGGVLQWAGGWYVAGQLAMLGRLLLLYPEALFHPQALTIDHDWFWITRWTAGLSVLAWATIYWRTSGWARWACLWMLIVALPRLLLPFLDGQHERHLYATSIGLCLALGGSLR